MLVTNKTEASSPLSEESFHAMVSEWELGTRLTSDLTEIAIPHSERSSTQDAKPFRFFFARSKLIQASWFWLFAKSLVKTLYLDPQEVRSRKRRRHGCCGVKSTATAMKHNTTYEQAKKNSFFAPRRLGYASG